jgi:hypothetical protein
MKIRLVLDRLVLVKRFSWDKSCLKEREGRLFLSMLAVFILHGVSYLMHVGFFVCLEFIVRLLLGGQLERIFPIPCILCDTVVYLGTILCYQ